MNKDDVQSYVAIIALCISICMGLKWLERHTDSLVRVYNENSKKQVKTDFKTLKHQKKGR